MSIPFGQPSRAREDPTPPATEPVEPFDLERYFSRSQRARHLRHRLGRGPPHPLPPTPSRAACATCRTSRATRSSTCGRCSPPARSTTPRSRRFSPAGSTRRRSTASRSRASCVAAGVRAGRARPRSRSTLPQRLEASAHVWLARAWPDFVAVHMTWGAINELTTLTGYRRLIAVARSSRCSPSSCPDRARRVAPLLSSTSSRRSAGWRAGNGARHAVLVERFWAPVGSRRAARRPRRASSRDYLFSGRRRARGGAQGRRHDPDASRIRRRAAPRRLDRSLRAAAAAGSSARAA